MLKRFFAGAFLVVITFSISFAQSVNPQWEYLIVSKTTISDRENPKISDKWLGIRQTTFGFVQQTLTQHGFDRLGNLGWELVGIDDNLSEGGTKEKYYIFKRRFDAAQSQTEAEDLKKLIEKSLNVKPPEPEFIDLDITETQNKTAQTSALIEKKLEDKLKSINTFNITEIKTTANKYNQFKNIRASITVDGSRTLLKEGNKYRSSEVNNFIRQVAEEVYKTVGLQRKYADEPTFENNIYNQDGSGTFIQIKVVVSHNGKTQTLAEGKVQGVWNEVSIQ